MGDEDCPESVDPVKFDQFITQGRVCNGLPVSGIFDQRRPCEMGVEKDLVSAVVKEQRRCSEKSYFHRFL